jgi:transposase-like protein
VPTIVKKGSQGKRYTEAQKKQILATARKDRLTGAQVRERFGVSTLAFYRWRGPVRGRRKRGRPVGSKNRVVAGSEIGNGLVREQVRMEVRRVLPQLIRQEVEAYLKRLLG